MAQSAALTHLLSIAKWSTENFYEHESGLVTPCLELPTNPGSHGYSTIHLGDVNDTGHHLFWTEIFGKPPKRDANGELLHLDHLCENRPCCWIGHLELVPMSENLRRARKNLCRAKLHEMTPENVYVYPGRQRICRACKRETQRKWAAVPGNRKPYVRRGRKLSPDAVRSIRRLLASGRSNSSIADEFGVGISNIQKIANGSLWKGVP